MTRLNPFIAVTAALLLSACAGGVGPDFTPPPAPQVDSYTQTPMEKVLTVKGGAPQNVQIGQTVSAQWWELFRSAPLNDMVKQAMAGNQTLAAARATLSASRQTVKQAEAAYMPQVDISAGVQHQEPFSKTLPSSNMYSIGPTVSYSPDVFGETGRTVERQEALAENQSYQLAAAYLTLTGNVVSQSINLASTRMQLDAVKEIIADDEKNLNLVKQKLEAGKAARTEILTAQSQLESDQAQLAPLKQQRSVARNALAVLLGKFPAQWKAPKFDLSSFTLPADLPLSLPSELVHQRPDILAAEAQLHAESAAIGVATAQMYPHITLSSSLTASALTPETLFNPSSAVWALLAGVTAPLFHGGELEAQKEAASDTFRAAAATYQQTVLEAFGQVANTLRALKHDAELVDAQQRALNTAKSSLELQRLSYGAGKSDLLQLLDSSRSVNQARTGLARAQAQRFQDTALLFTAMGGGWWQERDKVLATQ